MTNKKPITRVIIIQTLADALKPLDFVHAFWEGGAVAFSRIDEWSDIDLYLVVDDQKVDEAFLAVEKGLKSLSPIKHKYVTPHLPWPGVSQTFYKLEDASDYLVIDFAVLELTSQNKFLEPEIHGNALFYFNKSDKVNCPKLDRKALTEKLTERLKRLQARFDMFNNLVQKEINRGNHLEAIDFYYTLILTSLVEVLRIKYYPVHHDFRMRYVHYELPAEIVGKLKSLYFVRDENDLQKKYHRAVEWFRSLMVEIDQEEIEKPITMP